MYNPQSGVDGDEFVELYNTTGSDVDLHGWGFTAGITMTFDVDVVIPAHGYVIVSPDASRSLSTYGIQTAGTYTGKLDNGGERVSLSNNASTPVVVSTVVYDDVAPWPTSPDGNGPSLELKDPTLDNTLVASWAASIGGSTPGAVNSLVNLDTPTISDVTSAAGIDASVAVPITANVDNAATVELVYRTMFDVEQTLTMYDDGAHGDGVASDGQYGATIPGKAAGVLVRYKVVAENISSEVSSPGTNESINYFGYMVKDPSKDIASPTINWFIDDDDYDQMIIEDSLVAPFNEYSCVIVYGDQVFDNAQIRIKGEYSSGIEWPKRPFKVVLPSGYMLDIPEISDYPLKQFHLNSDFPHNTYVTSLASWDVVAHAGLADHPRGKVLLRRNGEVEGAYTMIEKFDKEWRQRHFSSSGKSFDTGLMYEDFYELSNGSDPGNALRDAVKTNLNVVDSPERRLYAMRNLEIPNIINHMSVLGVTRQSDWAQETNIITYLDTAGNGRWSTQPWDFDLAGNVTLGTFGAETVLGNEQIDPNVLPEYPFNITRYMFTPIWDDPTLRQMYVRRFRNLVDQLMASGQFETYLDNQYQAAASALSLDHEKWYDWDLQNGIFSGALGYFEANNIANNADIAPLVYDSILGPGWEQMNWSDEFYQQVVPFSPYNKIEFYKFRFRKQTNFWLNRYVEEGLLPEAEPANPSIKITEINYKAADGAGDEYLELYNPNDTAIDLSQWKLDGLNMTLPGGAVLPSHGYGVVVKDDPAFRNYYGGGQYVLGTYTGSLANEGETISLRRKDDSLVDQVTYAPSGELPSTTNGGGYSLELISTTANGAKASCWAPSSTNGSPAAINTPDSAWLASHQDICFPSDSAFIGNQPSVKLAAAQNPALALSDVEAMLLDSGSVQIAALDTSSTNGEADQKKATNATNPKQSLVSTLLIGVVGLAGLYWLLKRFVIGKS